MSRAPKTVENCAVMTAARTRGGRSRAGEGGVRIYLSRRRVLCQVPAAIGKVGMRWPVPGVKIVIVGCESVLVLGESKLARIEIVTIVQGAAPRKSGSG